MNRRDSKGNIIPKQGDSKIGGRYRQDGKMDLVVSQWNEYWDGGRWDIIKVYRDEDCEDTSE